MRGILDHLDEYMIGRGKLQRKAAEPPTENEIAPVVALQGQGPDQREANNLEDHAIVMISSLGVWQIDLRTATGCSQMLFIVVHQVHHDCSRCYEPGDRCTICQPLSDAEIEERFGELDSSRGSA